MFSSLLYSRTASNRIFIYCFAHFWILSNVNGITSKPRRIPISSVFHLIFFPSNSIFFSFFRSHRRKCCYVTLFAIYEYNTLSEKEVAVCFIFRRIALMFWNIQFQRHNNNGICMRMRRIAYTVNGCFYHELANTVHWNGVLNVKFSMWWKTKLYKTSVKILIMRCSKVVEVHILLLWKTLFVGKCE